MVWILGCFFVFTNAAAFFSTLFDFENDPEDEYQSTDFPCFNVGSICDVTPECCRPATCVLPAWSATPVCLVPGYKKHPEIMAADNPVRVKDILRVRNLYNTTYFDSLLRDFISGLHNLNSSVSASSENELNSNTTNDVNVYNVSEYNFLNNGNITESQATMNVSSLNNYSNNLSDSILENSFQELINSVKPTFQDKFNSEPNSSSSEDLRKSLRKLSLALQNHGKFLLLNSTITTHEYKINRNEIFENIKSDQFKDVVKIIQEKLKSLNENENKLASNSTKESKTMASVDKQELTKKPFIPTSTSKASKWDIVKKFFLAKKKTLDNPKIIAMGELTQMPIDVATKHNTKIDNHEMRIDNISLRVQNILSDKTDTVEAVRRVMDRFYDSNEIDGILKNNENIELINILNSNAVSDENVFEVYNIDIPYNLDQENKKYISGDKNKVENTFSTIAKNLNSLNLEDVKHNDDLKDDTATLFKQYTNKQTENNFETTTNKLLQKQTKKSRLWPKSYLWPSHSNISKKFTTELKNLFIWKKQKGNVKKKGLSSELDEKFLFTINSKNVSQKNSDYSNAQSEKTSSDYSFGYSSSVESASSGSEDLYNNSYVFVMPKKKTNDGKINSNWKGLLNFFHIARTIPDSKDKNISKTTIKNHTSVKLSSKEDVEKVLKNLTEVISRNISETASVHDVIRLPENLMPEVLERRQANETDILLFDDSQEIEDNFVEEHESSNSTYFLFFKW